MSNYPGVLSKLPEDLHYLIDPAEKYGRYHFDEHIFEFLDRAAEDEMNELAAIAERVLLNGDYKRVNSFLDTYSMTDWEEAADLYFLFGVMDYAELQFDRVEE